MISHTYHGNGIYVCIYSTYVRIVGVIELFMCTVLWTSATAHALTDCVSSCLRIMRFIGSNAQDTFVIHSSYACGALSCCSVRTEQVRNVESARVSVPKQFKW